MFVIAIFLTVAVLLGIVHGKYLAEKNPQRSRRWWIIHMILAPFQWPLNLVETVLGSFFWRGAVSLGIWLGGILLLKLIFMFSITACLLCTFAWWAAAAFVAGMAQETKKPYPFADPF